MGKLYAYDTLFVNNTVLRNGGAIRTQDGASSYIENCEFIGNFAGYHMSGGFFGGAIYTQDCELTVVSSTFKNNRIYDASGYGAQGGAISSDRGSGIINIKNCEFTNNTADGVGTVNGKTYCAKTNSKGVAKFNIKLTKKGKYTAKVKFAGNSTCKASNKSIKVTIK